MENVKEKLSRLKGHTILCGYGDVGGNIVENVKNLVVIDKDSKKVTNLLSEGVLSVEGNSTDSGVLLKAGADRAKSIIIALDSDPDVLFTIITAKDINSDLKVFARANHKDSVSKMKRVGANYVVCLPEIGGMELLKALSKHDKGT